MKKFFGGLLNGQASKSTSSSNVGLVQQAQASMTFTHTSVGPGGGIWGYDPRTSLSKYTEEELLEELARRSPLGKALE